MRGTSSRPRVTFQLTLPPPLVWTTATVIGTPLAAWPWHWKRSPFFTLRPDGHESFVSVTPPVFSRALIWLSSFLRSSELLEHEANVSAAPRTAAVFDAAIGTPISAPMSMPEWKPPQRSPYSDVTGPCTGQMNPPLVGLANELPFGVSFPRPLSFAAVDGPLDDSSARILASS